MNEALKKKIRFAYKGETLTTEDLYDLSCKELAEIGAELEQKVQKANGSTSHFVENKVDSETKLKLETVTAVYDERKADADRAENIRKKEQELDKLQKIQEAALFKKYETMSAEDIQKEVKKREAELAKLHEQD